MRIFKYILVAVTLMAASCSRNDGFDVYLLIGQSNMAGRGFLEPADTSSVLDGVFLLDNAGSAVPAVEPLNRYSTIRKGMPTQGVSLAHSFAVQMHENAGRKVLLVMNARGGTSIKSWMKGAPQGNYGTGSDDPQNWGKQMPSFYDEAVRRTREGMAHGHLKAIIWHQGESDSDPDRIAGYMDDLQKLVSDLRADLGVGEEVPFIAGGILPTHENAPAFNPMLERIGEWIPNSRYVSPEGLTGNPDNLHFNRSSQIEFGRRYAEALLSLTAPSYRDVIIPQPQVVKAMKGSCPHGAEPTVTIDTRMKHGPESYELTISENGISIKAGSEAGAFYAGQSLEQIREAYPGRLPAVKITDWPRFEYRGCHIDVSRHFWGKEVIMKQLDMFARLKLNRFHFHLTDGAGWRLQIDAYPLLTRKAAFRTKSDFYAWEADNLPYSSEDDPDAYGGYYTKDDIREILAYADSLHITVIPEIEMFGHSNEVTAAYPEVGCKKDGTRCSVFCVGKEETFHFIETVLDEVMELFPSEYIHIGGDEASKHYWKECPECQARIREEHLDGEDGLQSYGIKRIDEYVRSKGRKIIGWDEILEGGLAPGAAVMSWRGEDGGREAAAAGHKVIMAPGDFCYLDQVQNYPVVEPLGFGGMLKLPTVYSYDPAPADMPGRDMVMGVQSCVWTEMIEQASHLEYMIYPRVFAISEVAWTDPSAKDYDSFYRRALALSDVARRLGYEVFDQKGAILEPEGYSQVIGHLAYGCKVEYLTPFQEKYVQYGGGETALTDGLVGGFSYKDRWQGFKGTDASFVIDLGKTAAVGSVGTRFLQFSGIESMLPEGIRIELSLDGESFETVFDESYELDWENKNYCYRDYEWNAASPVEARYIRFTGRNNSRTRGWMLLDEVIVK